MEAGIVDDTNSDMISAMSAEEAARSLASSDVDPSKLAGILCHVADVVNVVGSSGKMHFQSAVIDEGRIDLAPCNLEHIVHNIEHVTWKVLTVTSVARPSAVSVTVT